MIVYKVMSVDKKDYHILHEIYSNLEAAKSRVERWAGKGKWVTSTNNGSDNAWDYIDHMEGNFTFYVEAQEVLDK